MICVDHIVETYNKKDGVAVCNIIEAFLAYLKRRLPTVKELIVVSDNACCYNNKLFHVLAPIIADTHGMYLKSIVHNEAQCGKGPVDAHFAVCMRHIYSYMVQHSADFATPAQVVYALRSNGGVRNNTIELLYIKQNGKNMC